jgi:hypothetical protein
LPSGETSSQGRSPLKGGSPLRGGSQLILLLSAPILRIAEVKVGEGEITNLSIMDSNINPLI